MKFFIDTANLDQIKQAQTLGVLDGVTTNPSLMAKEGIKGKERVMSHYLAICRIVQGDVSAEVLAVEYEAIIKEGKELAAIHPQIVVKVPMIENGVKAIRWFSSNNIRTNCTLVFSLGQALLAAKAGAQYVSPFIGRLDDTGWDGLALIQDMVSLYKVQQLSTNVLAASIRNPLHIVKAAQLGAHVCTCSLKSIQGLLQHPLTDKGLAIFLQDGNKMNIA